MRANPGDRIVVHPEHGQSVGRDGEILEVHGPDGGPPYLVRWSDNGHESLIFPGPSTEIAPLEHPRHEAAHA